MIDEIIKLLDSENEDIHKFELPEYYLSIIPGLIQCLNSENGEDINVGIEILNNTPNMIRNNFVWRIVSYLLEDKNNKWSLITITTTNHRIKYTIKLHPNMNYYITRIDF